jgi:hypothetical protein
VDDEPQPGLVEAHFTDALGRQWRLIDKAPIFSADNLTRDSAYPVAGVIRCEIISERDDGEGGKLVTIQANESESVDGEDRFEVLRNSLT